MEKNIKTEFNPEKNKFFISIELTTQLFSEYYNNFIGMMKSVKLSDKLDINLTGNNKVVITYPLNNVNPEKKLVILDEKSEVGKIFITVEEFRNEALGYKLRRTEFIPIKNYDINLLKTDVQEAIDKKRNFCLIDDYASFEKAKKENNYIYNQLYINYGTPDYSDVSIYIMKGDMNGLEEAYKNRLTLVNWD